MRKFFKHSGQLCALGALLLLGAPVFLSSCKEEIDESNYAIKKMQTAADYIDGNSQFSLMNALFHRVRLGNVDGASPLYSMLSARGNYTIFLATNDDFLLSSKILLPQLNLAAIRRHKRYKEH